MEESDLFEANRQLEFTIARLEYRISILTTALYQVGEDVRQIIKQTPMQYHVLCNNALLTISEALQLKFRNEEFLTRRQRERAQQRRSLGEIHPTSYNRTQTLIRNGVMVRDFIIIHTFLKFICSESSETQHLPSMLSSLLFVYHQLFPLEKKLKIVSETDNIKTPCSTDLLPSSQPTTSPVLELDPSSKSPLYSSTTAIHTEQTESISTLEIPIFKYFLNENGLQFLSSVLGGDEDILNVQASQHDDTITVCLFRFPLLFNIVPFIY